MFETFFGDLTSCRSMESSDWIAIKLIKILFKFILILCVHFFCLSISLKLSDD